MKVFEIDILFMQIWLNLNLKCRLSIECHINNSVVQNYIFPLQGSLRFDENVFLSAFTKFRKATINFVMSVRPYVRMGQLGSQWTDFYEN